MLDKGISRFQYSRFNSTRSKQYVIRGDDQAQFIKDRDFIDAEIDKDNGLNEITATPKTTYTPKATPPKPSDTCDKCGAEMRLSKNNKWYCSAKCWL